LIDRMSSRMSEKRSKKTQRRSGRRSAIFGVGGSSWRLRTLPGANGCGNLISSSGRGVFQVRVLYFLFFPEWIDDGRLNCGFGDGDEVRDGKDDGNLKLAHGV